MLITILVLIFTILVLVTIHELGHFLMAQKFNIKVLEFGFGIPPRAWGKKVGETLVSINWLPFGGFVRLLGEDEVDEKVLDNERSFAHQKVWKRITVVVAGVVMNILLAWVLFWIVLGMQGFKSQLPLLSPFHFVGVVQKNENVILIGDVSSHSPADLAGIKGGDRILDFNGQSITSADQLVEETKQHAGEKISLTLSQVDGTQVHKVEVTPRKNPPAGQGALGVSLGSFEVANLIYQTPLQKIFSGPVQSYNLAVYQYKIFGDLIAKSFKTHNLAPVSQNVAGPVGITSLVGQILQTKEVLVNYLNFLGLLSLSLGIINIFPFPGLDGGRLLFLVIEAVTRKKTHPVVERYVHSIGLVILIGLIILVTISDISKLV